MGNIRILFFVLFQNTPFLSLSDKAGVISWLINRCVPFRRINKFSMKTLDSCADLYGYRINRMVKHLLDHKCQLSSSKTNYRKVLHNIHLSKIVIFKRIRKDRSIFEGITV